MSRYSSDYLDDACRRMYGHTNWEYDTNNQNDDTTVVIFHKKPLSEEDE